MLSGITVLHTLGISSEIRDDKLRGYLGTDVQPRFWTKLHVTSYSLFPNQLNLCMLVIMRSINVQTYSYLYPILCHYFQTCVFFGNL